VSAAPAGVERREQLERTVAAVHARIARAALAAGRDPGSVTLVVVTKTFPVSDVRLLAALGVRDVGENRDQEAAVKAAACSGIGLRWHFVGQLQTNKAASVAAYADVVHSVDRLRLVDALQRGAAGAERSLDVLLQVDVGEMAGRAGRGGAGPDELPVLAAAVEAAPSLRLRGLMTVAPIGDDPVSAYARLGAFAAELRAAHPGADWVSAGMSEDFEAAVGAGATHVRLGSAILGQRAPLR
jgi:pyridoxal phosphate enzyme (YggS family)